MAPATIDKELTIINQIFNLAKTLEHLPYNHLDMKELRPKGLGNGGPRDTFSLDELVSLYEAFHATQGNHNRRSREDSQQVERMATLLLYTGLRTDELYRASTWSDDSADYRDDYGGGDHERPRPPSSHDLRQQHADECYYEREEQRAEQAGCRSQWAGDLSHRQRRYGHAAEGPVPAHELRQDEGGGERHGPAAVGLRQGSDHREDSDTDDGRLLDENSGEQFATVTAAREHYAMAE